MIKISFYVPESHLEPVKEAMFEAGAGRIGNYDQCAWQTLGTGQFRPLPGSHPHTGQQGQIDMVAEYQVEMVCDESQLPAVLQALKHTHPYEEPAYAAWPVMLG